MDWSNCSCFKTCALKGLKCSFGFDLFVFIDVYLHARAYLYWWLNCCISRASHRNLIPRSLMVSFFRRDEREKDVSCWSTPLQASKPADIVASALWKLVWLVVKGLCYVGVGSVSCCSTPLPFSQENWAFPTSRYRISMGKSTDSWCAHM
jgi:hypothetical protein